MKTWTIATTAAAAVAIGTLTTGCSSADCVTAPDAVIRAVTTGWNDRDSYPGSRGATKINNGYAVAIKIDGGWADGETATWRVGWNGQSAGPVFSGDKFADEVSDWPLQRGDDGDVGSCV